MIDDAAQSVRCAPTEAPPTLVWKVMARLDKHDRRRRIAKRWLAGATLAAATVVFRHRTRR